LGSHAGLYNQCCAVALPSVITCWKLLSLLPLPPMHLFTCFFLLWPLIILCYHLEVLSNLLGPQSSQKISNTADSYLDLTDLVLSESNWPYSGTSGPETTILPFNDLSSTQKSKYSIGYIKCFLTYTDYFCSSGPSL